MDRLGEAVQICRAMFDVGAASFDGQYHSIFEAFNYPRPVQKRIPILVGGNGERALRIVAQFADACNISGPLSSVRQKLTLLDQLCAELGRNTAEITKTTPKLIILRDTSRDAMRAANIIRPQFTRGELFDNFVIIGNLDEVSEQLASYLSEGLDGIVCAVDNSFVLESVVAAAEALIQATDHVFRR